MAGSFAVRQSKTILARSCEAGRAAKNDAGIKWMKHNDDGLSAFPKVEARPALDSMPVLYPPFCTPIEFFQRI